MKNAKPKLVAAPIALLAMMSFAPAISFAADDTTPRASQSMAERQSGNASAQKSDAQQLINQATNVVKKMKSDPQLAKYLDKAKGVYIVPEFGRGALVVGGRGGAGVMLAHQNGQWGSPVFFDFGAISLGPQVGVSGGSVAFLLMTEDSVKNFDDGNIFSLNAGAGLTIINYSANAQASLGKGDIIFWSNTGGAYAGATISLSDINWDNDNNRAYYGKTVTAADVINGRVTSTDSQQLKTALQG